MLQHADVDDNARGLHLCTRSSSVSTSGSGRQSGPPLAATEGAAVPGGAPLLASSP